MADNKQFPQADDQSEPETGFEESFASFDLQSKLVPEPIEVKSFHRRPITRPYKEAEAFFEQYKLETGRSFDIATRKAAFKAAIKSGSFATAHTVEELQFGTGVAWRNSVRCVGRMFWPSLKLFDARAAKTTDDMYEAILAHIAWAQNGGDLRSAITVFRPGAPEMRVLNSQLILYAGYRRSNETVLGDPKNIDFTEFVMKLGWRGAGTAYDILPLVLRIGDDAPVLYDLPRKDIIEVAIQHPDGPAFDDLELQWFALPAVANMALDMGGLAYSAAPTSGIYQGTEIASFNLGDPRRYDRLPKVAAALGLDTGPANPLWKDRALVELNRAVVHSFAKAGVRILDHHTLSESFKKFCTRETAHGRTVYGHWPWIVPPMSSNLSWIWHEPDFKKVILKPGYFYQSFPDDL